ncbi:slipin family protein [Pseudonocardia sp. S2-4]|uniref:Slipin family protein n=1 Tax=Pseudonocardia humida TaxID=2800819 RepID=A0ABT1ADH9_9PSEU|nr:slipin family protein [Pseudonocardia humida]
MTTILIALVAVVVLLVASSLRMVQQYQRGVVLRFGRMLPEVRQPGLRIMVPVADRMVKVPIQTIVLDVPPQGVITKDNVTLSVDAVVYFRVVDPVKAVVNVENYLGAISQVARTSLRSVVGRADLDTLLSDREQVNAELRAVIDTPTDDWGVSVDRVEVKDIALPEGMRRAMAHQAEAERDRRARVIAADGEFQASTRLADAARVMGAPSGAMQLRLLQTVSEVASEHNSTLVVPLPMEVMRFFEQATGGTGGATSVPAPPAPVPSVPAPSVPAPEPGEPPAPVDATPVGPERTDGDRAGAVAGSPEVGR